MFELTLRTYWADADRAGIVFYPNYYRFLEQAEEELFLAAGVDRLQLLLENHVWMPRVETFAKFLRPIPLGAAVRIRLYPQLKGEKTVRYDFEFFDDAGNEKIAAGYVTVVCVDDTNFSATPIPQPIRAAIEKAL
jgi:acyl-CoA thioester hydrolase